MRSHTNRTGPAPYLRSYAISQRAFLPTGDGCGGRTLGVSEPTILIVDDSDFILHLLETVFSTEGFRARVASSGLSAIAMAWAETPDVVLLDVRMPKTDGWHVLRALRSHGPTRDVPVVVTSTDDHAIGDTLAAARGAQAYVAKPFSPSDLVSRVRDVLAGC